MHTTATTRAARSRRAKIRRLTRLAIAACAAAIGLQAPTGCAQPSSPADAHHQAIDEPPAGRTGSRRLPRPRRRQRRRPSPRPTADRQGPRAHGGHPADRGRHRAAMGSSAWTRSDPAADGHPSNNSTPSGQPPPTDIDARIAVRRHSSTRSVAAAPSSGRRTTRPLLHRSDRLLRAPSAKVAPTLRRRRSR